MYKVALTGGIGTGKTYLSKHFEQMGIPVFYADDEAKKLYRDSLFKEKLLFLFGKDVFDDKGEIDFPQLSKIVFSNEERLQDLNRLIHPAVMRMFAEWAEKQSGDTVMMESAIVYENKLDSYFDKIIVVDAPLELRIKRILIRNPQLTREDILQRMSKQMPQEEKCRLADLVVCTGETYAEALAIK